MKHCPRCQQDFGRRSDQSDISWKLTKYCLPCKKQLIKDRDRNAKRKKKGQLPTNSLPPRGKLWVESTAESSVRISIHQVKLDIADRFNQGLL